MTATYCGAGCGSSVPWRGHRRDHTFDDCRRPRKRRQAPELGSGRRKGDPLDDGGWAPYQGDTR